MAKNEFVIRAHHLNHYKKISNGASPQDAMSQLKEELDERANLSRYRTTDEDLEYVHDVVGGPGDGYWAFFNGVLKAFETFRDLDPSALIKLTAMPDDICASCQVGNHCKETDVKAENKYINFVDRHARSFGLKVKRAQDLLILKADLDQVLRL